MTKQNVKMRLFWIGFLLILALVVLINFRTGQLNLKPGIDIAGGVSMIFEINERPGEQNDPQMAERMKTLLAQRVDPDGVMGLEWRVQGANRIEVQMPLPSADKIKMREEYNDALEGLFKDNIQRSEIEKVLREPPEQRAGRIAQLAGDSARRKELLQAAASAYDAYVAAVEAERQGPPATQPAEAAGEPTTTQATQPQEQITADSLELAKRDAEEAFGDAVDAVLDTNFPRRRFQDLLDLDVNSTAFKNGIEELKSQFPEMAAQIEEVVGRNREWKGAKGFLDGPADLKRLLRGAGVLEFRILAEPNPDNRTQYDENRRQLQERGPQAGRGEFGWFLIDNPIAFFNLDSPAELQNFDPQNARSMVAEKYGEDFYVLAHLGNEFGLLHNDSGPQWELEQAHPDSDEFGRPCVVFRLNVVGGNLFRDLTGRFVNHQLCILVDDVAYSTATIQEAIGRVGRITGDFSYDKVQYLVHTMEAGSLPGRLKDTPLSERTIESSLGKENLNKALRAGIIGLILVVLTMAVYYGVCGLIADAALMMNIVLILAAMSLINANFSLASIAGVILTIGMAVDANVLIFERMREEQQRGSSLRMIIANGYSKALSAIVDANITTLLTCVIIYYVGSEEIKGFGLTLGWGIVWTLFTSLFVTRTIFMLLVEYRWLKQIRMLSIIGVPKVDWYGKRKFFIPLSLVIALGGVLALTTRGAKDVFDIEFLGGVNVEVQVRSDDLNATQISGELEKAADTIAAQGAKLAGASITAIPGEVGAYRVQAQDVPPAALAAMITEPLEDADLIRRGGVDTHESGEGLVVRVAGEVTAEQLTGAIHNLADAKEGIPRAADNIARANVNAVVDTGDPTEKGRIWNISTTETNKTLVQEALVSALGDELVRRPAVSFVFEGQNDRPYPITERRLEAVIASLPAGAGGDVTDYLGGAALYYTHLDPPLAEDDLRARIEAMRLQPQPGGRYYRSHAFDVYGITPAGTDEAGKTTYSSLVVATVDPEFLYSDKPDEWYEQFAADQVTLANSALETEQTLRKVLQFKPSIAAQSMRMAIIALVLSWTMTIGYLWIRFGRAMYGLAGIAALIHDVFIAMAFVGFSGLEAKFLGFLLVEDFKVNMTIIAALLTIIGYSINDTIIIFDRIRETRGRLGRVTPEIINRSINECMSRTILTSGTTLIVLLTMYIFGGSSIRGFNFCMIIGILTGTYSSVAVAAPLLMLRATKFRAEAGAPARAPATGAAPR